jgi:hypothetical protein
MIFGSDPIDSWVTFDNVADKLRLTGLCEAGGDMTLDIGHSYLRLLLQTGDQFFIVRVTLDEFGQMLPMLHEIDAAPLPDDKKDILGGLAGRFADDA